MRITAIFLALPVLLAFSDPAQAATIQLANGGNWDVNDVEYTVSTPNSLLKNPGFALPYDDCRKRHGGTHDGTRSA